MDSHPPSPTSQPSLPRSVPSSHNHSKVPNTPISLAEQKVFEEYMVRRRRFLSDYETYRPVQNMQTLANQVFDFSENVHSLSVKVSHIENNVAESRRMLDMVVTQQRDGEKNLSKIGDDVIGLKTRFAGVEGCGFSCEYSIGTAFLACIFDCIYTTAMFYLIGPVFRPYTKGFDEDFPLSDDIPFESLAYVQMCSPPSLNIHSPTTRDRCWKWCQ
ncbi:hypothetical protein L873DRAFT_1838830 [Choiromyces venosus 120613-1]|uniref:Uncharacterized protein n=1 Tax=Choiromyces venosus 120613-1 TaxID=1336337 RepID=A0A3N4J3D5_9PEZI|nr:hypothetical protein L873DRAFT_1838830 [Choiromyces venosus 120613-1]